MAPAVSSFVPLYRPHRPRSSIHKESSTLEKKRKRKSDDDDSHHTKDVYLSRDDETGDTPILHASRDHQSQQEDQSTNESSDDGKLSNGLKEGRKQSRTQQNLTAQLGELQPPLTRPHRGPSAQVDGDGRARIGNRQRHLTNLTAILHRSLLNADYRRAGRAWSLLLRTEMDGHSMDLRFANRWGIGAELLQHRRGMQQRSLEGGEQASPSLIDSRLAVDSIEESNIEIVLEYFARLIVQYPWNKYAPMMTSEVDFLYAMLSLWICYTVEKPNTSMALESKGVVVASRQDDRQRLIREARKISEKLDENIQKLPYLDSKALRRLQQMVHEWRTDLMDKDEDTVPDDMGFA